MSATSFTTYLKTEIPNHLKAIGIVVAVAVSIWGFNEIRDLKNELKVQQQTAATLAQQYKAVGSQAISGNSVGTQASLQQQTATAFSPEVVALMKQQNATIQSLTQAQAQTKAQTNNIAPNSLSGFGTTQVTPTGALTGYTLEQARIGPPLSAVHLFYDPSQTDPVKAFSGTSWESYAENFSTGVGTWEQQKTGGFKTSISLSRTVTKPDPNDPTKTVVVGTEQIPITGSNTIYTPKSIAPGVFTVPRWTVLAGVSTVPGSSEYYPAATLDYRITSKFGVFGGTANKAFVGGVSIRIK